ncbi:MULTISPECIES: hypothetical protein [Capnocytophaga]|jgi:hypothetical protein|uniref:Uncharacterized protein n=1 Tax=Capnocytophaga ochracea TaxID=1018 RepID=A0AA46W9F1_CAPOC|nr:MULTISPECIES: hypothetical protein [Capnocytophaga]QLF50653.1 hypothetical protein HW278_08025 [Capnocytophaga sp. oral taxon 902]UZD41924.1 hypothetical protein OL231_05090 [Capnocytophaga ochracea]
MKTKAIIDNFLYKIELFYRNFGNEWSINDFAEDENQKNVIKEFLPFLESKGIIEIVSEEKFKIIDLPSNRL